MVAHKDRKIRKRRGSRTCGWGRVGQHRDHGRLGGHGKAGIHKHKWNQNQPKYAGKTGFKCPKGLGRTVNVINVGELQELANALVTNKKAKSEDRKIVFDLSELGYNKLLGKGRITEAMIVKAPAASKSAIKKIEEAGGEVLKPN
ncbi:uL15 family ribosomal protein [Candidatus Bathyarchaeota archaeon]|nr:uL15 family ribosomal protein [Candidatus Bathyarchaeota archaeon]